MLKKTISFTDYDGNQRQEDYYFNLSKAELVEMDYSQNGGLDKMIHRIIQTRDSSRQMALFKDLIKKSYGVKSLDGKQFIKNPEVLAEFTQSEAYVELFMELCTSAEAAAEFIKGIVPKDISEAIAKQGV